MVGIGARHVLEQFEGHFQVGEEGWDYVHALGKDKKVFPYFCYVPFTLNFKTLISSLLFIKAKPSGIVHEDKTKHVQQSLEHEHAIEQPIEMKGGVESIEFKEGELLMQTQQ